MGLGFTAGLVDTTTFAAGAAALVPFGSTLAPDFAGAGAGFAAGLDATGFVGAGFVLTGFAAVFGAGLPAADLAAGFAPDLALPDDALAVEADLDGGDFLLGTLVSRVAAERWAFGGESS
jgi:hypothetical protein